MKRGKISRRAFIERSVLALGASSISIDLLAQSTLKVRPEWQTFKTTPRYDSLLKAIRSMKANTNPADPNSWAYWTNIHVHKCPHNIPYFFAWHRAYLFYLERRLRMVSGDSQLTLPYWDYYANATMPAEFTNPHSTNPLYADRVNHNVRPALTMAPFASTVTNFQRGQVNAFETSCEDAPHNPVHDIIGGVMATMESPVDPIFWLHHANVDRLWVAWVSAGGGRKMPLRTSSYWSGVHIYTDSLTIARSSTYTTRSPMGYRYANETLPAKLPLAHGSAANLRRVRSMPADISVSIPPIGSFQISAPHETGKQTFSISGAVNIGLDNKSISVQLPTSSEHSRALATIGAGKPGTIPERNDVYRSVQITLDGVELAEIAKRGGFFYQLYLNIPKRTGLPARPKSILIGTLGAFQINGAAHHAHGAIQLRYPIKHHLFGASPNELSNMSLSFVRVDGERSPQGGLIGLGEVRLELSTDDKESGG